MITIGQLEILIGSDVTGGLKPIRGFPPGRVRIRIRDPHDEVIACVRTKEGLRTFLITEKDGHWVPVLERCQGNYHPLYVNPVNTVNPVPPPPARVLPERTPPLEVIIPEGRAYSIRPGPAPGELCLAITIFAAFIGFVLLILWILSFSRE